MDNRVAYCGLACVVCGKKEDCSGCRNEGCSGKDWCKNYNCCREKSINGCWECDEFPCMGSDNNLVNMLDKPRIRIFANFIKKYGEDEFIECLVHNEQTGIKYHYDGEIVGDYDRCETEEVIDMLLFGK